MSLSMKNKLNFALVSRVQWSEAPYLNEFIAYYVHLGCRTIYLVNTEPLNFDKLKNQVAEEFREQVKIINELDERPLDDSPNRALKKVEETFLLHVDMDEFLYLDGMSLPEFVEREGLQPFGREPLKIVFQWINTPLCNSLYSSSIKAIADQRYFFESVSVKCMGETREITSLAPHNMTYISRAKTIKYCPIKTNYFVLHFCSRGIFDIINKIQFGKYTDAKRSLNPGLELKELIFDESSTFLPNRFKLFAFLGRFNSHLVSPPVDYPSLGYETNVELLRTITDGGLEKLLHAKVVEGNLEKVVMKKVSEFHIPKNLVELYAAKKIGLLDVLNRLQRE